MAAVAPAGRDTTGTSVGRGAYVQDRGVKKVSQDGDLHADTMCVTIDTPHHGTHTRGD